MLVLAVDTSTPTVTAGVVSVSTVGAPTVLAERTTHGARRHVEALAPQIVECLQVAGAAATDISAVVAGVGPGPFTGLRVGLATAAAFADAIGRPCYAVTSLDAIARAAVEHPDLADADIDPASAFLVCTDARRREVYWAMYGAAGEPLTPPDVARPAAVREWCEAAGRIPTPRWAVGAGATLYADTFQLPIPVTAVPTAAALVTIASPRILAAAPSEPLTPHYLRRPDAEVATVRKSVLER